MTRPDNIFSAIPDALDSEIFELLAAGGDTRIERIISRGQSSPDSGWYNQPQSEWVIVLRGSALLEYQSGEAFRLEEGSHLNIPAGTAHRVAWTASDTETVWLAVHYGRGAPM
jgi:cupin 2 domain-containing protein